MRNLKKAKIRIRGKWWKIIVGSCNGMGKAEGFCVYDERTIYLKPGTDLPSTLLHEVAHAALPDINEDAIEELEAAQMNALNAMGLLIK